MNITNRGVHIPFYFPSVGKPSVFQARYYFMLDEARLEAAVQFLQYIGIIDFASQCAKRRVIVLSF